MQDWPDANSWIANPETLLTDMVRLSDAFDEVMMRGPSTPRTLDMGQVEMNWADFVATARRFSRRLRAAQTEVSFPVDANAIIRVADIVDELNYGPQRWQTSTDEPDREHTTMEFKELYFEPYVMCHHIFVDAISTVREYLSLNERANPETPVKDKERPSKKGPAERKLAQQKTAKHSEHFDSVNWNGTHYTFTSKQAAVVKVLWKAWLSGKPSVLAVVLLDAAQSDGRRVRDIFKPGTKTNPAWGTMIIKDGQSHYKLSDPKTSEPQ